MKTEHTRILVADDDPNVLKVTVCILDMFGFPVTPALGSEAAMAALIRRDYDLVLTDLRMPGADGIAVLKKAKERNPRVKVIIMTGSPDDVSILRARRNGVDGFLVKPFRIEDLRREIEGCLTKRDLPLESLASV